MIKKLSWLVLGCTLGVAVQAEEGSSTSMDIIAEQMTIPCSSELRLLAGASLKANPHRMLTYEEQPDDVHLFNALAVTSYRDRDSHVTFHGVRNSLGQCDTSVTETFVLDTNCADARHEAFSDWGFEGKLTDRTLVLSHKEIDGKQAFLTDQFNRLCLVTSRQVIFNGE